MKTRHSQGRWLFLAATFIAASALGGLIKIPSPVGSIALDSAPGYFLAAYVHPVLGAVVGGIGHLASAASAGFPLGYVHIWVAMQVFVWCLSFGYIARAFDTQWALIPAILVAALLNGVVGPLMLGLLKLVNMGLAVAVIPVLTVASIANLLIAAAAVRLLSLSAARRAAR